MSYDHRALTRRTLFPFHGVAGARTNGHCSIPARQDFQKGRERSLQRFVVERRWNSDQLPHLSILEGDLQDASFFLVCECFYFRVKYHDGRNVNGIDAMRAVLNTFVALAAEDHCRRLLY